MALKQSAWIQLVFLAIFSSSVAAQEAARADASATQRTAAVAAPPPGEDRPLWCAYCDDYEYAGYSAPYHLWIIWSGEACEESDPGCTECPDPPYANECYDDTWGFYAREEDCGPEDDPCECQYTVFSCEIWFDSLLVEVQDIVTRSDVPALIRAMATSHGTLQFSAGVIRARGCGVAADRDIILPTDLTNWLHAIQQLNTTVTLNH